MFLFANSPNGDSQGAFIIFVKYDKCQCCPIYWQNKTPLLRQLYNLNAQTVVYIYLISPGGDATALMSEL